jgi:ATP-dependent protease ClpP protease subunit
VSVESRAANAVATFLEGRGDAFRARRWKDAALFDKATQNAVLRMGREAVFNEALNHVPCVAIGRKNGCHVININSEIAFQSSPAELIDAASWAQSFKLVIDSNGGDSAWTFAMAAALAATRKPVEAEIRLAASAAGLLAQFAHHRRILHDGRIMVHCSNLAVIGNRHDLKRALEASDQCDDLAKQILKARTKLTDIEIENLYDGQDHWFDAQQSLDAGLVDEVI